MDYFAYSRVLYEWSPIVCILFRPASLTQHNYFVIYLFWACQGFFLLLQSSSLLSSALREP